MLHDDRFATGQIAKCAVADPRCLQLDIGRLGAAKLSARALNIGLVHLRCAGDLTCLPDAPTTILQVLPLFHVALRTQNEGQLQGLTSDLRQTGELQESYSFCVLVSFIAVHNPIGGVPDRYCREGLATWVKGIGPALEANRWPDVNPVGTAIWNLPTASSNALADSEIKIVVRHAELLPTDPKLQKAGIDVHQRRTLKAGQQRGTDGVVEIQ